MRKLSLVMLLAIVSCGLLIAEGSSEQEYPSKPITVIVPYSAGGGTDRMARTITPFLEEELGVSVIVQNVAGAAGELGMAEMTSAEPDGYTLGLIGFPDNYSMGAYKDVSYENDNFHYLAAFTETPTILAVPPDSRFGSVDELVQYARNNPGEIAVSESGDSHLITAVLLEQAADISLTTVNYDGAGDNLAALLGGHVDAAALAVLFSDEVRDQNAEILALAGAQRMETLPEVPTFRELGYDVRAISSRVLTTPVGTPADRIATLQAALDRIGESEEFEEAIKKSGEVFAYRSGDELDDFVEEVRDTVVGVIEANIEKFER